MADNVTIKDAGQANVVIATDQVTDGTLGSVEVQFMKVMDGTLDSTNKWVINADGSAKINGNVISGALEGGTISSSANVFYTAGQVITSNTTRTFAANTAIGHSVDKIGRQVVVTGHVREMIGRASITLTNTVAETTFIAATAGEAHDITHFSISNGSSIPTAVELRDATAGTLVKKWNLPGGGTISESYNPPLPQAAVNTTWTLTSLTSVDSVYANATYARNI